MSKQLPPLTPSMANRSTDGRSPSMECYHEKNVADAVSNHPNPLTG
jgi:hypothetical protein